ncbi:MAG: hypothetical protein IJ688_09090 [Treponema sp.]|nr:hypothetical protein [Treponema sp.]
MKRYFEKFKILVFSMLTAIFISAVFLSCTNPIDGTVSNKTSGISIVIENYASINVENSSRTISPQTPYSTNNVAYFKLDGENTTGETFEEASITIQNDGTGTISGLKNSIWNFVLHAYDSNNKEVLRGYATADNRFGSASVPFTLSTDYVTTYGNCGITLVYSDEDSFSSVTQVRMYVCDWITQRALYTTYSSSSDSDFTFSDWTDPDKGYTLSYNNMNPGIYWLVVRFYSSGVEIGNYSDFLDIQPGLKTEQKVIIDDVLYRRPDKPTNLKVYRVDSSLTDTDYYNVVIRWTDSSINEDGFVLKVYRYSLTNTITEYGSNFATITTTNQSNFHVSEDGIGYVAGNLFSGSEEIVVKLQNGYLYDFQIFAENSLGLSDAASREASTTIDNDSTYGKLTGYGVSASAPFNRINNFAITYMLRGGTYKPNHIESFYQNLIKYYIYENEPIDLFEPGEIVLDENDAILSSSSYPIIFYGSGLKPWTGWTDSHNNPITTTSEYTNLMVYANYSDSSIPSISLDSDYIYATYGNDEVSSAYGSGTNVNGVSNLVVGTYVTLTVDLTQNSNFSAFDFYVNGMKQERKVPASGETTLSYSFIVSLKGTYTLQVAGICNDTAFYSTEYSFSTAN